MKKIWNILIIILCCSSLLDGQIERPRAAAEWEESQALLVSWHSYPHILTEIVRHAVEECTVIIATENEGEVAFLLQSAGVPLQQVEFVNIPTNTLWIRDYGPWSVYENKVGDLHLVDWLYNRPNRELDDKYSHELAELLDLPILATDQASSLFIHTGGNILRDGMNTAFSSDLIFRDNTLVNQRMVNLRMKQYMGIENYVIFPRVPYDEIHHLDMHMRLIDEETILIGEYPEGIADGPQIEKNVEWIATNLRTPFGNRYKIVRLPMPPDENGAFPHQNGGYRTYTNAVFVNKTILVPTYGVFEDDIALSIYQEELPGYTVQGIDCSDIIHQAGALHCVTKLLGAAEPLWIAHPKLRDQYESQQNNTITVIADHIEGVESVGVYYREEGETMWQNQALEKLEEEHKWQTTLPNFEVNTTVEYYIKAIAADGKQQYRPMTAPSGYYHYDIIPSTNTPIARFEQKTKVGCVNTPLEFYDESTQAPNRWLWSAEGGNAETDWEVKDVSLLFTSPKEYEVLLEVENEFGESETTASSTIFIDKGVRPFYESFEEGIGEYWQIVNVDDNQTWVRQQTPLGYAMKMDNFTLQTGGSERDVFRTLVDLRQYSHCALGFKFAYAQRDIPGSSGVGSDDLQVVITSCTGERNVVYNNSGSALATRPILNTNFIPSSEEQWDEVWVDLSAYDGAEFYLSFEAIYGKGNNLYIDEIYVEGDKILNQSPQLELTAPIDGIQYEGVDELPVELTITANVRDLDSYIAGVDFWINDTYLGYDDSYPYSMNGTLYEAGTYTIKAIAEDEQGVMSVADEHQVEVKPFATDYVCTLQQTIIAEDLELNLEIPTDENVKYRIMNALGQLVAQGSWVLPQGQYQKGISLSGQSNGQYYIEVSSENIDCKQTFLIAH